MATGETHVQGESAPGAGEGTLAPPPDDHNVFPPFDAGTFPSQLLWLAITFGLFYYLMAKVALPRIAGILEDRRDRIATDLDMAERLKGESEDALTGYEKALAEARGKAFEIAEAARDAAKAAAEAETAETEAELHRKLEGAETRISEIKTRALAEVGTIAGEVTGAIVQALTETKTAAKEVEEAVAGAMAQRSGNAG
jgi:F-type H+-transporting ATPase subunit b